MAGNLVKVKGADGVTNTLASTDVGSGVQAGNVLIVDATQTYQMPTGDAQARAVQVAPGDGTNGFKSAGATNVNAKSGNNAQLVAEPGQWVATSAPIVNTQASASQAAGGAGVRHVCNAISATLVADTTAPAATVATLNLRDGATGAGTVLASWTLAIEAVAGDKCIINLSGLNIPGSANTAMTLEFAAAGGAHTFESCTLIGHDAS